MPEGMIAMRPPACIKIWERPFDPSPGQASNTTFSGCQQRRTIVLGFFWRLFLDTLLEKL
jgi:hypothetical protein